MAVNWNPEANVTRTGQGYSVNPLNVIIQPELSGRFDATDITDLAKSIKANGQRQPALCWKNPEGWPVVAAGHRRLRAILKVNEELPEGSKYPLLFNFIPARSEEEAFAYTIVENRDRLNPSPLDDGHNMHVLLHRFGKSEEQIARIYYPEINSEEEFASKVREVKNCLALLDLSPEAQEELRKGFLTTSAGLQLAQIPSQKKQNEVIQKAKDEGKKKLKVADAKEAKEQVIGSPIPRKTISENTPVKLLEKYKALADLAGTLAAMVRFDQEPNKELVDEISETILVACKKLGVPLLPEADTWADKHKDVELPLALVS